MTWRRFDRAGSTASPGAGIRSADASPNQLGIGTRPSTVGLPPSLPGSQIPAGIGCRDESGQKGANHVWGFRPASQPPDEVTEAVRVLRCLHLASTTRCGWSGTGK